MIDFKENFDVILWWSEKNDLYKKLSRMTADLLSLQPSGNASERTVSFSLGGMSISKSRTSLHTESARELMCLKSWNNNFPLSTTDSSVTWTKLSYDCLNGVKKSIFIEDGV